MMCNYSDYVWEDGNKKGNQEKALKMFFLLVQEKHWSYEEALQFVTDTLEEYNWVKARLANAT